MEYIQKKLFAALKIPKAYLGYDEEIGSKATLAQEDIRFSRTITRIQKTVLAELNKLAMVHLYAHGFEDEELLDFELQLSNPSAIAQQQKLELINTKFSIAGSAPEGMVSKTWIRKNVMGFSRDEIVQINSELVSEKIKDAEIEAAQAAGAGGDDGGDAGEDDGGDDAGGGLFAADQTIGDILNGNKTDRSMDYFNEADEENDSESFDEDSLDEIDLEGFEFKGIKKSNKAKNAFGEDLKPHKINRQKLHMPDFASMTSVGKNSRTQDSMNRPYDEDFILGKNFSEGTLKDLLFPENNEYLSIERPKLNNEMHKSLENFRNRFGIDKMLNESIVEEEFELDIEEDDD